MRLAIYRTINAYYDVNCTNDKLLVSLSFHASEKGLRLAHHKSITYSEANLGGGIRLLPLRSDRGRLYREKRKSIGAFKLSMSME